jgi:glucose-1-phosphate adenylyltransferase
LDRRRQGKASPVGRDRTLVLVLAGGAGSRLAPLTDGRAKPAVPYGGHYRLIDVPLSNCLHSGLSDVWVLQQFDPASLTDHLANGRPWDLDRSYGGLLILHPRLGERGGFHRGTADALWRNAGLIREYDPRTLVVVSADAVYRLDYAAVAAAHRAAGAAATFVTTRVDRGDAGRYGVVTAAGDRVTGYAYKPDEPASDVITTEVFAFDPGPTLDALDAIAADLGDAVDDGALGDLGDTLLPGLVDGGAVRQHRFDGYWRDLGTLPAYWQAHRDLLADPPRFDPGDPGWPVRTAAGQRAPARVAAGATVVGSLLAGECRVAGTAERSVVGPAAVIEAGAVVRDSVLLAGAVVGAGAQVERAIVDEGGRIERGARLAPDGPAESWDGVPAVLGRAAVLGAGEASAGR